MQSQRLKEELIQGLLQMAMTGQELAERSVLVGGDVALVVGTTELRFAAPDGKERVDPEVYRDVCEARGWMAPAGFTDATESAARIGRASTWRKRRSAPS